MADRRLLVWALASFHAAGFTLAVVVAGHWGNALTDTLPAFGTVPGVLGYAYLWVLSFLATRWALTAEALEATLDGPLGKVLLRGTVAGSLLGMAVLLGPLLLVSVPDLLVGGGNPRSLALVTLIGAGVAAVIGAGVGLAFGLLDVAVARTARALVGR